MRLIQKRSIGGMVLVVLVLLSCLLAMAMVGVSWTIVVGLAHRTSWVRSRGPGAVVKSVVAVDSRLVQRVSGSSPDGHSAVMRIVRHPDGRSFQGVLGPADGEDGWLIVSGEGPLDRVLARAVELWDLKRRQTESERASEAMLWEHQGKSTEQLVSQRLARAGVASSRISDLVKRVRESCHHPLSLGGSLVPGTHASKGP